jgi:hypothetical protein
MILLDFISSIISEDQIFIKALKLKNGHRIKAVMFYINITYFFESLKKRFIKSLIYERRCACSDNLSSCER